MSNTVREKEPERLLLSSRLRSNSGVSDAVYVAVKLFMTALESKHTGFIDSEFSTNKVGLLLRVSRIMVLKERHKIYIMNNTW